MASALGGSGGGGGGGVGGKTTGNGARGRPCPEPEPGGGLHGWMGLLEAGRRTSFVNTHYTSSLLFCFYTLSGSASGLQSPHLYYSSPSPSRAAPASAPPLARAADRPSRYPHSPHRRAHTPTTHPHSQPSTTVLLLLLLLPPPPAPASPFRAFPSLPSIFLPRMPRRRRPADVRTWIAIAIAVSWPLRVWKRRRCRSSFSGARRWLETEGCAVCR